MDLSWVLGQFLERSQLVKAEAEEIGTWPGGCKKDMFWVPGPLASTIPPRLGKLRI